MSDQPRRDELAARIDRVSGIASDVPAAWTNAFGTRVIIAAPAAAA